MKMARLTTVTLTGLFALLIWSGATFAAQMQGSKSIGSQKPAVSANHRKGVKKSSYKVKKFYTRYNTKGKATVNRANLFKSRRAGKRNAERASVPARQIAPKQNTAQAAPAKTGKSMMASRKIHRAGVRNASLKGRKNYRRHFERKSINRTKTIKTKKTAHPLM